MNRQMELTRGVIRQWRNFLVCLTYTSHPFTVPGSLSRKTSLERVGWGGKGPTYPCLTDGKDLTSTRQNTENPETRTDHLDKSSHQIRKDGSGRDIPRSVSRHGLPDPGLKSEVEMVT